MNAERNEFMLLFRGTDWYKTVSPEQAQQVAADWGAWFRQLSADGKVAGASPLECSGKVISGKGGRVIADGPFAESKEAIGGYFLLTVGAMEEAVAIAQQCPGLPFGVKVEVRQLMAECPMMKEAAKEPQLAEAMA